MTHCPTKQKSQIAKNCKDLANRLTYKSGSVHREKNFLLNKMFQSPDSSDFNFINIFYAFIALKMVVLQLIKAIKIYLEK
jgi:hypothetical protein